jgi:hypothetical protein
VTLDPGVETATIDIDVSGRMWLASDGDTAINVRWSGSPYSEWSAPIALAEGVNEDDICVVTAFPNGEVGVLWSNQNTRRFGFRMHCAGDAPTAWSDDEAPASASALSVGDGMADDHLNCAMAADGTLYVAVKTSYDTEGYAKIGLLVRRPSGAWDDLYYVDDEGTRPIALLNEERGVLLVAYNWGDAIVYRSTRLETIAFGERQSLVTKKGARVNNVTSTKESFADEVTILGSTSRTAEGARLVIAADSPLTAKTVHVFVALCDNEHQGIVPVPKLIGNGEDPRNNLYWGASYGVKTFLKKSKAWEVVSMDTEVKEPVLERLILKHRKTGAYLVADAYRGAKIKKAVTDFLNAAAGNNGSVLKAGDAALGLSGKASLVAYVGHNGLMDFEVLNPSKAEDSGERAAVVLACLSKRYFEARLEALGCGPVLLTTGLMAPEAYTLDAALEVWLAGKDASEMRTTAAKAYDHYQKCGLKGAMRLFYAGE